MYKGRFNFSAGFCYGYPVEIILLTICDNLRSLPIGSADFQIP
jgi:hypothetical protein